MEAIALPLALPTAKTRPTLSATSAKVLLYGPPKIGKSTLAAAIDPDHTLFLATEPGLGALEVFKQSITCWEDFRAVYALLGAGDHPYTTVVVDTVDLLYDYCSDAAMKELNVTHPADLEWGKGWKAVIDKFRLGVGALASLGLGVWFISHSKDIEIQQRVGKITKTVPTLSNAGYNFVSGFVDHIFYAAKIDTTEGEQRVIHTDASEYWEAGSRSEAVSSLEMIPLAAGAVLDALGA